MVNTVLYSMFGDPWGGWSFGPRYLIPSIALLSTGIGYALSRSLRNPFSILFFTILLIYSTVVSVLGSTTTNLIPPKVEALNLAVTVPYTYFYNIQLAETGNSGLLLYNLAIKNYFNVLNYVYIYSAVIILLILSLYSSAILFTKYPKSEKLKFSFLSLWRKNK
jgi:hypothetical protein